MTTVGTVVNELVVKGVGGGGEGGGGEGAKE